MLVKVVTDNKVCYFQGILGDHIHAYIEDRTIDAIVGCTGKNVYQDYILFCKENSLFNNLNSNQFRNRLCRRYGLNTKVYQISGRSTRVIVRK